MSGEPSNPYAPPAIAPVTPPSRQSPSHDLWGWVRYGLLGQVLGLGLTDMLWVGVALILDEKADKPEVLTPVLAAIAATLGLNLVVCVSMLVALRGPWQPQHRRLLLLGAGLACLVVSIQLGSVALEFSGVAPGGPPPEAFVVMSLIINLCKTIAAGCSAAAVGRQFGLPTQARVILWLGGLLAAVSLMLQAWLLMAGLPEPGDPMHTFALLGALSLMGTLPMQPGVEWVFFLAAGAITFVRGSFDPPPLLLAAVPVGGLAHLVLHLLYGHLLFSAAAPPE